MSYLSYKVLHLIAILFLFSSLGTLAAVGRSDDERLRRLAGIVHGISVTIILVAGFGLLARLGFLADIPRWAWLKMAVWASLALAAWPLRRHREWAVALWVLLPLLGGLAAWLAIAKPI